MRASRYVAGFDSSGAMLRALARFLNGQEFPAPGNPRVLAPLLVAGNLLPARLRERLYAASGGLTAVPAKRLGRPFAEDVAAWMTSLYPRPADRVVTSTHRAAAGGSNTELRRTSFGSPAGRASPPTAVPVSR